MKIRWMFLLLVLVTYGAPAWAAGGDDHGEEHGGHHHVPTLEDFNWFNGFFGEKEGVEPNWMWRAPGTPVPFGAMLLNTAVLFFLLGRFGGPALRKALKKRKADLTQGMAQAERMQAEARERLDEYEAKLAKIDDEIEAVKQQIRTAGEGERDRVLRDASAKRSRMERDARLLIELELKAAREALFEEAARAAVRAARDTIMRQLNSSDEQRIQQEYLDSVKQAKSFRGRT
jgi:F-type H+-transporting ATPase subunit b